MPPNHESTSTAPQLAARAQAERLFAEGHTAQHVAARLEIPLGTAKGWRHRWQKRQGTAGPTPAGLPTTPLEALDHNIGTAYRAVEAAEATGALNVIAPLLNTLRKMEKERDELKALQPEEEDANKGSAAWMAKRAVALMLAPDVGAIAIQDHQLNRFLRGLLS